ncbi:MAG: phosphoribosylglycinamide formyltransferase [Bacteroidetes bacterium]|nr:MAG: phosphoribosylglycinamide formyltransferase [Bacteroidota bacterium]
MKKNIAIFASGSGSNAQRIAEYFQNNIQIDVKKIYTDNPNAFVIKRAENLNIPIEIFSYAKDMKNKKSSWAKAFLDENYDLVVLAGFMRLIPEYVIKHYKNKIINIHPSLLPKYGGKGMYGHHVHQSVYENKEPKSGITIHYVNKYFDKGEIIFQAECPLTEKDNPDKIAEKVQKLEHKYFPIIIEKLLT